MSEGAQGLAVQKLVAQKPAVRTSWRRLKLCASPAENMAHG